MLRLLRHLLRDWLQPPRAGIAHIASCAEPLVELRRNLVAVLGLLSLPAPHHLAVRGHVGSPVTVTGADLYSSSCRSAWHRYHCPVCSSCSTVYPSSGKLSSSTGTQAEDAEGFAGGGRGAGRVTGDWAGFLRCWHLYS